ncbi:thermonuclease family protein [Nocardioides KLBMP 9356]|uniref:Thermonuclease family protein n=1 Tax=Nocardioides potassii TaxID=2911371 RepID=A0ABS9HGH6_9ACTN|nr:thermonuclease family protein [Nocardioides potassii]MCF6379218.1 thermonuclease family protein [Nocardioides potassii]
MHRLVLLLVALVSTSLLVVPSASAADMDCGDFATQSEAQAFFVAAGPGDPHLLDADGDGVACEGNPCPCSTSIVPLVGTATPTPTPSPTPAVDPDGSGTSGPTPRDRVVVVRVSDGDTLRVLMPDGTEEYVRLLGIDTPEIYSRRECGGPQATRAMRRLAPVGSSVVIVSDPSQGDRDRYGRLLRYVQRSGKDVGKAQVSAGLAQVYVYRRDPFDRVGAYQRAERRAMRADRGSWGRCWR